MKEQILKLRQEGKTYSEIKKVLGCSKSTISYHCGEDQKEKTKKRTNKRRSVIGIRKEEYNKYRDKKKAHSKKCRVLAKDHYINDLLKDCKVKEPIDKHRKKLLVKRIRKVIKKIDEK